MKLYKKAVSIITIIYLVLLEGVVFADKIQDSIVVKGFQNLIKDATTALMVIAPIAGILLVVFFFFRKGAADDMEQKTWQKRINVAIYSVIGAEVAGSVVQLVLSYFK